MTRRSGLWRTLPAAARRAWSLDRSFIGVGFWPSRPGVAGSSGGAALVPAGAEPAEGHPRGEPRADLSRPDPGSRRGDRPGERPAPAKGLEDAECCGVEALVKEAVVVPVDRDERAR